MTPRSAISAFDLLLRALRSCRGLVAVFALITQLGFLAHQAEHHLNFDIAASDDCALCHFGTAMVSPPEAIPVPIPAAEFVAVTIRTPDTRTPRSTSTTAFNSRAPPVSRI